MKLNLVRRRDAPLPPYQGALVCISAESVPYVLSSLWLRSAKYWWRTEADWLTGRRMLFENGANMLTDCGQEIVKAVDRVYRLIDSNQNGTVYSFTGDGTPENPVIISPPIPTVPISALYDEPGERYFVESIRDALRNLLNGATTSEYPDNRNVRQQLDDIKTALEAMGQDDDDIENLLNLILLALG